MGTRYFFAGKAGRSIALRPRSCRDTLPERFPIKARCRSETRTLVRVDGATKVLSGGTDAKSIVVDLSRRCGLVRGRRPLRDPRTHQNVEEPERLVMPAGNYANQRH